MSFLTVLMSEAARRLVAIRTANHCSAPGLSRVKSLFTLFGGPSSLPSRPLGARSGRVYEMSMLRERQLCRHKDLLVGDDEP